MPFKTMKPDSRDDLKPQLSARKLKEHPNSPPAAYNDGINQFAEIYGSSMVSSNRLFVLAVIAGIAALVSVVAIAMIFPLKEIRPWVVETNAATGLVNRPIEVEKVTPSQAVIKAELARWAEGIYIIDRYKTLDAWKFAIARTREKAIDQFALFRARERSLDRITKEPGLLREVKITSVDASQPGFAFVFLTTTERQGTDAISATAVKKYRLTLNYVLDPARTEEQILANPLGIYVTLMNEIEEGKS